MSTRSTVVGMMALATGAPIIGDAPVLAKPLDPCFSLVGEAVRENNKIRHEFAVDANLMGQRNSEGGSGCFQVL